MTRLSKCVRFHTLVLVAALSAACDRAAPTGGKAADPSPAASQVRPVVQEPAVVLPPARSVVKVQVDGIERSYILILPTGPAGYDGHRKVPLVMLLHGASDSAAYAEEAYHYAEQSAKGNFALVIPDALGESHAWTSLATADDPHATSNDLKFLTGVLESLPKQYLIDPSRMYVCGHSVGAIMTYRLAAERPDLVAAAGIVSGTVGSTGYSPNSIIPTPKVAVPLIIFHGKKDGVLPYDGDNPGIYSVAKSVAFWQTINQSKIPPAVDRPVPTVQREVYSSPIGADIVVYSLDRGNHMWPGGKVMPGKFEDPVQDINATELMWAFFAAHPRTAPAQK